jgi:hypothetical protein
MSNINIQSQIIGTYGFLKPFDTTREFVNLQEVEAEAVEEIEVETEVCE